MHTFFQRIHQFLGFLLSTTIFIIIVNSISGLYLDDSEPEISIQLNKIHEFKNNARTDRAVIGFDLHADFTSTFNWNVKQIFVFVTAEYQPEGRGKSEVVIWDHIIRSKEEAVLDLVDQKNKYVLVDYENDLRGQIINLTVNWDVMPLNGFLRLKKHGKTQFTLPEKI
ncbi:microsomal signal peptidase 23 kd subunit spc22/23 [Anaeramoeba ignava]|uniref:Signal peptidase complex subunit 3 n=1 Tax=Anaeramoeba ignava TaxID=1746090 RepID=A0A9Q0LT90_ANAIG|nr:microsomal signal peptidase 23 kd subunit spc22/23 [Anaeramoeba ignava]|eukprot:Anaeramoba_ignava/a100456_33.p1 GENE.a100456_33~~a100456_33.p1  ORF type:complete len:168 (-),score=56.25 a100456_33:67-570(-)